MNKHIKKAIERFLQPTIEEMVHYKIAYMGDEIEKMAEDSVESAIGSARIDHMIEEEVRDKMRDYDFEDDIRDAAENFDFSYQVMDYLKESDAVAEFITTNVRDAIQKMEFVNEMGVVFKLVVKEKTDEEAKTAD